MSEFETYKLGDIDLHKGGVLPNARLVYKTYGKLNVPRDNAVLLPTFYTGSHLRNDLYFQPVDNALEVNLDKEWRVADL